MAFSSVRRLFCGQALQILINSWCFIFFPFKQTLSLLECNYLINWAYPTEESLTPNRTSALKHIVYTRHRNVKISCILCTFSLNLTHFFSCLLRPCVGIHAAPPEDQQWFCVKCSSKKKDKKHKKRKHKLH